MAERRMFSKTIIDSDLFLDLPISARLLYYDLGMRADDDGFVNSPKKIIRIIGASLDDLKLLILKKFIYSFDSGVIVIKDWNVNNSIRSDRYKETRYLDEKAQLRIDNKHSYILIDQTNNEENNRIDSENVWQPNDNQMDTKWQPNGNQMATKWIPSDNQMETQDRLGKDSIDKVSIDKNRIDNNISDDNKLSSPPQPKKSNIDYEYFINKYNEICKSLPQVKIISESRKKEIKNRLKTYKKEQIEEAFKMAEESEFLKGKNDRKWKADFDWIIKDGNIAKILDGKYKKRQTSYYGYSPEEDHELDFLFKK